MPIGTGIIYNVGDLILSQVSGSGTSFLETKIAAATSSIVYFDNTARINSASLNSITVGTASYVSGSTSIITNLTASNISASGTGSFGMVGIGTTLPSEKLHVVGNGLITSGSAVDLRIDVSGTGNASLTIDRQTTGAESKILLLDGNVSQWGIAAKASSNNFVIRDADSTERFTILKSGGNVGIGTTSPGSKLDVAGTINISSGSANLRRLSFDASGVYYNWIESGGSVGAGYMAFAAGNSEGMRLITGGNVGIGTSSPASKLHISGSGQTIMRLDSDTTTNVSQFQIKAASDAVLIMGMLGGSAASTNFGVTAAGQAYIGTTTLGTTHPTSLVIGNVSTIPIVFSTNNTEKMRIASDGNVGIGTTSVSSNLHIYALTGPELRLSAGGTGTGGLRFLKGDSGVSYINNQDSYAMQFQIAGNTKMSILADGNVGIGTTTTTAKLHVSGSTGGVFEVDTLGGATSFYVSASGNVGIGTTAPADKLSVISGSTRIASTALAGALYLGNDTSNIYLQRDNSYDLSLVQNGDSNSALYLASAGSVYVNIDSNNNDTDKAFIVQNNALKAGTELFRVSETGNVGIGTSIPSQKLHIKSTDTFAAIKFTNSVSDAGIISYSSDNLYFYTANAQRITIDTAGNVGIGTTSPGTKLEVSGSIRGGSFPVLVTNTGEAWFGRGSDRTLGTYTLQLGGSSATGTKFEIVDRAWTKVIASISGEAPVDSFLINSSGNVGIGAGVPASKLQVNGNISGSSFTSSISNAVGFLGTSSWAQNVVSASYALTSSFATTAQTANALNVANTYTIAGLTSAYVDVNGSGTIPTTGIYRPSTKTLGLSADGTLIFKISNVSSPATSSIETGNFVVQSGNFGLGTNSPNNKLDIFGGTGTTLNMSNVDDGNRGGKLTFISSSATGRQFYVGTNSSIYNLVFGIDSIEKARIDTNGNLGIGTTAPAATLHVSGSSGATATFQGSTQSTMNLKVGSFDNYLVGTSTGDISIRPSGSTAVTILSAGNVGIGTTSPGAKLQVAGNISGSSFTSSISNAVGFLGTSSWAQNVVSSSFATTAQTANALNTGNSYTISGLTVNGNISASGTISASKLRVVGTANVIELAQSSIGSATYYVMDNTVETGGRRYRFGYSGASADLGSFTIYNQTDNITPLTITTSGSVGIGATNPSTPLHVFNTAATLATFTRDLATDVGFSIGADSNGTVFSTAGAHAYQFYTNGTEKVRIASDGNVGIGTTSPAAKLDVVSSPTAIGTIIRVRDTVTLGTGSFAGIHFTSNPGTDYTIGKLTTAAGTGLLQIRDQSGNQFVTVDSGGNVGIGTTAPAAKLEISGSSNSVLLNIKSAISGAILYVSGSGAVGIGTSNVGAYTLQVSGSFAATTKSFVIEHPTKAGKKLIYGSLESPYHGIRLTGRDTLVNGKCKIQLPDYIYKLILHDSVNIQLTGIKCNKTLYVDEINIPENYFTIAYDKAIFESYKDYDFFWDFTGIRTDVPELITEL